MKKIYYSIVSKISEGNRITIPPKMMKKLNITEYVRKEYRQGEDFIRIYKGEAENEKLF